VLPTENGVICARHPQITAHFPDYPHLYMLAGQWDIIVSDCDTCIDGIIFFMMI